MIFSENYWRIEKQQQQKKYKVESISGAERIMIIILALYTKMKRVEEKKTEKQKNAIDWDGGNMG